MAEFIYAFTRFGPLPMHRLPKVPHLLTGQIALHHCLAPSFIDYLRTCMRM
ncbi:MAG: hypothetical protein KME25_17290 [Symplocastrum torsivum CPER-KK1]|uniref:Uncharacterized protein n=1 Tax=Symplocastrum torsivum CPER-KK1 TaxID=450513 RepID=A0A951UAL7_9CYAN|nr:hypothetical protein [Symplocastrum torsivum CPER-KK1]